MDSFSNVLARMGVNTPNLLEGTEYPMTRLTRNYQLMNSLYRGHWIIRKIIDTIPEDAVRNWITITSQLPPEDIRKIDKLWRTRRVKKKILDGMKWGRLYGGALGLILIEGHEDILAQPLDFDTIMPGAFKGLLIVDRWSGAMPGAELVEDVNDPDFGLPAYYELTMENGQLARVHHTRVVRFVGRELPYWEKLAETYWGESEVEIVFDELKKRDNTSWNIAMLVFMANLRVYKMGDLGETLAIGDEKMQKDIYNTVQAQNILMSSFGINIMSSQDAFETHQYTFSGLSDVYQNFMLDLAGACNMPATKLFGRSPEGMNATGESDMQNYYETVQQSQETTLSPVLDKLLPIMCMSELGAIPDDLDYSFNPIRTPDDKEVAELVDKKSTAITNVYNAGLISQRVAMKELKQLGDSTGMFTTITDEDIDNADDSLHTGELGGEDYGTTGMGFMGTQEADRGGLQESNQAFDERPRWLDRWLKRSRRNSARH